LPNALVVKSGKQLAKQKCWQTVGAAGDGSANSSCASDFCMPHCQIMPAQL